MRASFVRGRARVRVWVAATGVMLGCAAERPAPPLPAPETEREVSQGRVIGLVGDDGAHVWRGLPFAASTAGESRWRAPRPAPTWRGVRKALAFAERCAQRTNVFDEDEGLEPGQIVGSEDCLALDVYAPPDAEGRALPVLFWIHGGANVWGRSSAYDGSRLAVNEDVIVVAVQYRLGPLGWLSHELLRQSADRPEDAAACFATLDLIAALHWVRENIDAFSGEARNVTVFGESAGGHNVVTLLASPRARSSPASGYRAPASSERSRSRSSSARSRAMRPASSTSRA